LVAAAEAVASDAYQAEADAIILRVAGFLVIMDKHRHRMGFDKEDRDAETRSGVRP
jgi:hypothetical protein